MMDEQVSEPMSDPLPRVADLEPPSGLEDRLHDALVRERLLRPTRRPNWRLWSGVAAGFVVGLLVGLGVTRASGPVSAGPRYVLLLYPGEGQPRASADRESSARAHREWATGLRAQGRVIGGERLSPENPALVGFTGDDAPAVPQGYFVTTATSIEDARHVAESSPHVRSGGRIVVQPIDTPR